MKWRKRRASLLILLMYPSMLLVLLTRDTTVHLKDEKTDISDAQSEQYIVPYLKGQGLNNQLWEYRTAAIVSKKMNRKLCLEPFHRFYLLKYGREFIPFEELFDVGALQRYTTTSDKEQCAIQCRKKINHYIEFSSKDLPPKKKRFATADWRPGSLIKFKKSTGFDSVPAAVSICTSSTCKSSFGRNFTFNELGTHLSSLKSKECIAISGVIPELHQEFLLWSRSIKVSKNIKHVVDEIRTRFFEGRSYMAIHWRFEESKCAGAGKGIGFGRAAKSSVGNTEHIVRKSDNEANLCFFGGTIPSFVKKNGIWLRLVSRKAIVQWIGTIMKERSLEDVYIATDCQDPEILEWIKLKTGAKSKSDVVQIISEHMNLEENDVTSRIEQQLCTEAEIFAGTLQSSWTGTVIEERLLKHDFFFMQDKFKLNLRPDPENRTFYLDVESCNCEW